MRKIAAAAVLSLLSVGLAACGDAKAGAGGWPTGRTFWSISVTGHALVAGTRIELRFPGDGEIGAQAGCNHLGGEGRLDGGKLVVGATSTTEMGCDPDRMAQDEWLVDFLSARPTWQLTGDELVLTGGPVRVTFTDREVADPDRPLAGTRWVVDTVITGDTASSVPSGASAYLEFDGVRAVSGATGCGAISGVAKPGTDVISFARVVGAGDTCTTESAGLDTAVRATLRGEVAYEIDGPTLALTGPDGHGLRLRAE